MDKKKLRERIKNQRDALPDKIREEKSQRIAHRFLSLPEFQSARCIMCYVTFQSEVDTIPIIESSLNQRKMVTVPLAEKTHRRLLISEVRDINRELVPGSYGIREPAENFRRIISSRLLDLMIIPGVAFDFHGNRLGYGGGYYDRLLKTLSSGVPLIALAYDLQVVEEIPAKHHDIKVYKIVTESRLINCYHPEIINS